MFNYISYDKELLDTQKLITTISDSEWVDSTLVIINVNPDYSSNFSQLINHKLSYLNGNDLFESTSLEIPRGNMQQVFNRCSLEYPIFDRYLFEWISRNMVKGYKYLFVDSVSSKYFAKIQSVLKDKFDYKFASLYVPDNLGFTPDFFLEYYHGKILFQWENSDNER